MEQPFARRGERADEMLEVLAKLWAGGWVEHHGEFYDFDQVEMSPAPTERIPIYVGGISEPALRRAARHDGWISDLHTIDELREITTKLRRYREELGRADEPFAVRGLDPRGRRPRRLPPRRRRRRDPPRSRCRGSSTAASPRTWAPASTASAASPTTSSPSTDRPHLPVKVALPGPCSLKESTPTRASSVRNTSTKSCCSRARPAASEASRPWSIARLAMAWAATGPRASSAAHSTAASSGDPSTTRSTRPIR